MSDAHLVLARHNSALSCFYVPRWLDEKRRNNVHIQRLKDKLGNVSNASAEVEFQNAHATLVGEEGRGIAMLAQMASYTRLDCVLGSTALLRQAVVQALHHASHRSAFGRLLIDHELMQSVLIDLVLESEAATALALRLAYAVDQSDPLNRAINRIITPAAKFWVCKRTIEATAECMEVWGGNGYIEDGPMARLYREAPVNSIWEGSGNTMCLDVLRALERHPELAQALCDHLSQEARQDTSLNVRMQDLMQLLSAGHNQPLAQARYVAQELVLLTQAVLLLKHGSQELADAFVRSRYASTTGRVYGLRQDAALRRNILDRARVQVDDLLRD